MKKMQQSQAYLRKRKMMMVLPLLVIPFLTMAFWSLGGGRVARGETNQSQGLNLHLPNPKLNYEFADKLSFYDKADRDSMKLAEQIRNDPYYLHNDSMQDVYLKQITVDAADKFKVPNLKLSPGNKVTTEDEVMKRLADLNKVINQPEQTVSKNGVSHDDKDKAMNFGNDIDKLEAMMQTLNKGNGEDPAIRQLDGTLEKILDIQHPERLKERSKENVKEDAVFKVTKFKLDKVSLLDTVKNESGMETGFFGATSDLSLIGDNNAIEAVVHEDQSLVNGAVVKLRLLNEVRVDNTSIPKGTFVFGVASLNRERLEIEINSICYNKSLYPVALKVYDMDGLPGIYIPGAITRDVAKQTADNSLQLMQLSTMDPSLKAQAASAGIGAAKDLLSKKVKMTKVFVKAGYKVLLK
jgi:conjugative transposon TraM protein